MNIDKRIATRQSYGEKLAELGEKNDNIIVFDADVAGATKTSIFKKGVQHNGRYTGAVQTAAKIKRNNINMQTHLIN